jgi:hypothetical protein
LEIRYHFSSWRDPISSAHPVVELELQAIQWAVEKCQLYLSGTDFTVITDHQPLLGILNRKNLDAINNICIRPTIADTFLRNPVFAPPDHKDIIIRQVTEVIEDEALERTSEIAAADRDYQEVVATIRSGTYDGNKIKNLHKSHPANQPMGPSGR